MSAAVGDGPLVVRCHDWPESWYSWRHQVAELADAGYRAVAPDQQGYGQTDAPQAIEAYHILHLTADIVGLVHALGEEQAVIAGHDWGSPVAWYCALITVELPTIDYPRLNGRHYRHFYSTGISNDPGAIFYDQLASVDTVAALYVSWRQSGHFPGEPVFVRRPGSSAEVDGILLSVVLEGRAGRSYLLALDPPTLEPRARAFLPHHVPCGFHSTFFRG